MAYNFFYLSALFTIILFFTCLHFRKIHRPGIIIGIATVGYSLISDVTFGGFLRLFYYISPQKSELYMVLAALLIYPFLNMAYTLFLPQKPLLIFAYTGSWIIGMLIFEYLSVLTGTVVFTGWRPVPWSIILYAVTYFWLYLLYRYFELNPNKMKTPR